jgi:hypothetical protein
MAPVTAVTPAVTAEAPAPDRTSGITPFSLVTGVVVIILAGSGILFVRQWWIRRQNPVLFEER